MFLINFSQWKCACVGVNNLVILLRARYKRQSLIDAIQKETAIDQQQHSCETLICQRHQTILRLLSSAAKASTRWRVRELNCPTTYTQMMDDGSSSGRVLTVSTLRGVLSQILECFGLQWISRQKACPKSLLIFTKLRGVLSHMT